MCGSSAEGSRSSLEGTVGTLPPSPALAHASPILPVCQLLVTGQVDFSAASAGFGCLHLVNEIMLTVILRVFIFGQVLCTSSSAGSFISTDTCCLRHFELHELKMVPIEAASRHQVSYDIIFKPTRLPADHSAHHQPEHVLMRPLQVVAVRCCWSIGAPVSIFAQLHCLQLDT